MWSLNRPFSKFRLMRTLTSFMFITLNGFYKGENDDISWHRHGGEESEYSEEMLESDNILLFGRKTYENMVSFWPTQTAKEMFPKVAEGMNSAEKIVFSNSLNNATWKNTKIVSGDIVSQITKLKQSKGKDMAILGSGTIVSLFAGHRLIDEYQIMIDPVVIEKGTVIFENIISAVNLKLTSFKTFKSGVVLLNYAPL